MKVFSIVAILALSLFQGVQAQPALITPVHLACVDPEVLHATLEGRGSIFTLARCMYFPDESPIVVMYQGTTTVQANNVVGFGDIDTIEIVYGIDRGGTVIYFGRLPEIVETMEKQLKEQALDPA